MAEGLLITRRRCALLPASAGSAPSAMARRAVLELGPMYRFSTASLSFAQRRSRSAVRRGSIPPERQYSSRRQSTCSVSSVTWARRRSPWFLDSEGSQGPRTMPKRSRISRLVMNSVAMPTASPTAKASSRTRSVAADGRHASLPISGNKGVGLLERASACPDSAVHGSRCSSPNSRSRAGRRARRASRSRPRGRICFCSPAWSLKCV